MNTMHDAPPSFRNRALVENGRPRLVLSGEVQYFRTPREHWRTMFRRLKEARCDTLSTYVPWSWHEVADGVFDFTGKTHPSRDLVTFLAMAADHGLKLVAKPGPYVFAELLNGGVPAWYLKSHPESIALGPDGKSCARVLKFPHVTYLHPSYMEHARRWLTEAWWVLMRHADRTLMIQVDNEINYSHSFFWFGPYTIDYHPFLVKGGVYQRWLEREFGSLARINDRYRSRYRRFEDVKPPVAWDPSPATQCRTLDWTAFKEWIAVEQVRRCCNHLHALGAHGPFCVNAPFTGWATAWNNTKRWMTPAPYDVVIAHVDYPGAITDGNFGETLGLIHYARSCDNVIDTNLETQACTVSKIWGKHGASYDLTHKSLIGAGMNTINYYWFNDGVNFLGQGHYQTSHEYGCPLDVRGRPREHYFGIKRLNRFLAAHPEIAETRPVSEAAVGYVHEWGRANFLARWDGGMEHRTNALLNLLGACDVSFEMLDMRDWDPARTRPKTLFVQSSRFMPRTAMASLVAYVRAGGHLILSNYLPLLDEDIAPCGDLVRAFGAGRVTEMPAKPGPLEPNKIRIAGKEIFILDRFQAFAPGRGARTIATSAGMVCGFERRLGRGRATVLGFKLEYLFTELHRVVVASLLGRKPAGPCPVLTRTGNGVTLKTVCNLEDEPRTVTVDGKKIRLPGKTAGFVLRAGRRKTVFV